MDVGMSVDKVLSAYNLTSEFPERWSEPGERAGAAGETHEGDSSTYVLTHQLMSGINAGANLALDERDPLGSSASVISILQSRGINVDKDPALRAKYLLSSPRFNAKLFLREVHGHDSYEELKGGLEYLQMSMSTQNDSLRTLVDHDYEQFVTSKRNLDDVMGQLNSDKISGKNKGLENLKQQLDEATNKCAAVARPLEELNSEKYRYQSALKLVAENKYILDLPTTLEKHISSNEHHDFVRDYRRGMEEITELAGAQNPPQCRRIAVTIDHRVRAIVSSYQQNLWKQLMRAQTEKNSLRYCEMLADLGVEKNPTFEWMIFYAQKFHGSLQEFFDQLRTRTRAMHAESGHVPSDVTLAIALASVIKDGEQEETNSNVNTPLDGFEITKHWSQVVEMFRELEELVKEACAFWRDCTVLIGGHKLSPQLALTGQQEAVVKEKFFTVISFIGAQLGGVFAPARPGDGSASHFDETGSTNARVQLVPYGANIVSTAVYMCQVYEILARTVAEISEVASANNPCSNALSQARTQILHILCTKWASESINFGSVQDWASSSVESLREIPPYFRTYHCWVLDHLKVILTMDKHQRPSSQVIAFIGQHLTTALSLSVKSLHIRLTESDRLAKLAKKDESLVDLELCPLPEDTKVLITMQNFHELYNVIQVIFEHFQALSPALTVTADPAIFKTLEETQDRLFDLYLRKKSILISKIFSQIPSYAGAFAENKSPVNVSNFVNEALLVLVEVHSKFYELNPGMLYRILDALHQSLLSSFLSSLRDLERLGKFGVLQLVADIEFIRSILYSLQTPATTDLVVRVYDTIKDLTVDKSLWAAQDTPRQLVKRVIEKALRGENLTYTCLNGVKKPQAETI